MNEIVALDAVSKNGLEIPTVFIRYPYRAQSFIQYPIRSAYSTRCSSSGEYKPRFFLLLGFRNPEQRAKKTIIKHFIGEFCLNSLIVSDTTISVVAIWPQN